ncbi:MULTISPECIES: LysR family transcriptional regulator [Rhizobium/Agrobacterium group]|uniref:LysR family transcriptional regulator n=1 Tax=Rhizobium/Agrobacterium group TaxID=227290 RepID=UPI001574BD87|nr:MULTISPECIES: LysR family transcriptional regulator [Rhizobium/Agrobacterium group]NTD86790.1 LysR family transcriptional regulator [Agrobacterium tumefaciens]NTD91517.1 LysR family transcriptional regulator [Agrobacterium tumefaciens]NTD96987.1 LysR family transcriptional regulator [Agrobacterium tumefaciens]NTE11889.1 LysR family transcriptional regulator [Agrobacterium tumefaciens]NTE24786.1 LysR family transcriptional regulator [Agrobacterium tumefaciens]
MDRWSEIEVFTHVAELGSVSKAAQALGMSVSAASRHLIALEERLRVRLIQRTTRQLYLTVEGEKFFAQSKEFLQGMKEAEINISDVALNPTGLLRVSASLSFCLLHLNPIIAQFTKEYPNVTFDVVASNRYYDIIENGVDVAIRTRRVESDSSITIRRLAETRRLLAASPEYLAQRGAPTHPAELKDHDLILYTLADNWNQLAFSRNGETVTMPVNGLINSNDGQVIVKAALDGLGILAQPTYIIAEELSSGRLVRVLDHWDLPRLTMNIAFPTKAYLPARTRLFIDYLVRNFKDSDYEGQWTL